MFSFANQPKRRKGKGQLPLKNGLVAEQSHPSGTPQRAVGGSWLYWSMNYVSSLGLASRSVAKNKVLVKL